MNVFVHSSSDCNAQVNCHATPAVPISQIAEGRLRSSSYWAVRTISCDYHKGVLILRGRVSAYYLKQIAQSVVMEMDGVLEITNDIEVVRPSEPSAYPDLTGLD